MIDPPPPDFLSLAVVVLLFLAWIFVGALIALLGMINGNRKAEDDEQWHDLNRRDRQ